MAKIPTPTRAIERTFAKIERRWGATFSFLCAIFFRV